MATTLQVINSEGADVGAFEIDPVLLEREKGSQAVHESVVAFLAEARAGTASTKTRGNVRGGGVKPYRQKGTGRARAGSIRSPLWRGGGTIFGPLPRSYKKGINKKVLRLALRRAFTERVDEGAVILVEDMVFDSPKTKTMLAFLNAVGAGDDALIIVDEYDINVCLAGRNLPGVEVMKSTSVNAYWMLLFKKIVLTRAGLELLCQRLSA